MIVTDDQVAIAMEALQARHTKPNGPASSIPIAWCRSTNCAPEPSRPIWSTA